MLLDEKAYIANLEHLIDEAFDAFVEQVERAEAAEATGRAAVRALANVYDCAQSGRCRRCWSAANAVLTTDVVYRIGGILRMGAGFRLRPRQREWR